MCGIVAAIANHHVLTTLVQGLQRLEYRGYDSTGGAVLKGTDVDQPCNLAKSVTVE